MLRLLLALSVGAFTAAVGSAHEGHEPSGTAMHGTLVPAKEANPEWLAKAKAEYPSASCFVSGDKLEGDMGGPVDYVYKEEGKPDRLIRFCCRDCLKDFQKDPAKYISALDKAAAEKAASGKHAH